MHVVEILVSGGGKVPSGNVYRRVQNLCFWTKFISPVPNNEILSSSASCDCFPNAGFFLLLEIPPIVFLMCLN